MKCEILISSGSLQLVIFEDGEISLNDKFIIGKVIFEENEFQIIPNNKRFIHFIEDNFDFIIGVYKEAFYER